MWGTGCISGKHDEYDPSSRDTKRQQVLGTSAHTDWLVSTVGEISLCQRSVPCANTGPLTLLFFPHSIKMQSVWLIVVSCALRRDHHQLFRPFTWCRTTITMKVIVMPICTDVYTCCKHGQAEEFKSDRIYVFILKFLQAHYCLYAPTTIV